MPHFLKEGAYGLYRVFLELSALFSLIARPPLSVVLRAPSFQVSGVMTLPNFLVHFSQTMLMKLKYLKKIVF